MAINLLNDISSTGSITITKPTTDPLLNLYNTTNGGGATIRFSDNTSQGQVGDITFYHSDSSSQGGGASWHFVSQPDTVLVVGSSSVNGRFVAKSAGSVAEVDYGFFDDVNTGMYRISADYLGFSTAGTNRLDINNSGIRMGNANARVTTILDQNDLGSDSDTALATQQSIKAYVDASVPSLTNYVTLTTAQTITGTKTINTLIIGSSAKIQFQNNDFIRYDDSVGVGRFHFDADGGTNNASVQAATFVGDLNGTINTATTGTTQSAGNNSTLIATTAYVDAGDARVAPAAPSTVTSTIVGETIEIAFNQSATSNIDYYQVWSSDDGGDYGIIGQIAPADFSSTMTVVDTTFVTGGTMSYRVYAVKTGIYSSAATTSKSYTVSALSVTAMTVVNLNTAYYIQYEKPVSRFIDHIEIYMDSQATSAALNRSNASIVYSGQNASYMRNVGTSNNFHQFWVEVVTT